MDFHRENTQALDNAYQQKTLRLGWGRIGLMVFHHVLLLVMPIECIERKI